MLARWPYDQLDHLAAPEGVLRLGCSGARNLARLEVRDPALALPIDEASVPVDRSGATERRGRIKVVVWSIVATVSLVLAAVLRGAGARQPARTAGAAARRAPARRGGGRAGAQDARQG